MWTWKLIEYLKLKIDPNLYLSNHFPLSLFYTLKFKRDRITGFICKMYSTYVVNIIILIIIYVYKYNFGQSCQLPGIFRKNRNSWEIPGNGVFWKLSRGSRKIRKRTESTESHWSLYSREIPFPANFVSRKIPFPQILRLIQRQRIFHWNHTNLHLNGFRLSVTV